jgi:hypothetical protein
MRAIALALLVLLAPVTDFAASPDAGLPSVSASAGSFARHVSALGATKPDGAPLDARLGTSPRLERQSCLIDTTIRQAICNAC